MATVGSGLSLLRTLLATIAAIAAFFLIDTVLAKTEKAESNAVARRAYENGMRLMQQRRYPDAAGQFDEATSLARESPAYKMALAEALLAANHPLQAEAILNDLLEHDGTGG